MIYVIGTGRCGTSTVARVLHEQLGINMGPRLGPPDEHNPQGYYEDLELKTFNQTLMVGGMGLPAFLAAISSVRRVEPWGFKDPRLAYLLPFYLEYVPGDRTVIHCQREREQVVRSMCRCYGWSVGDASKECERRENMIARIACDRVVLNFSDPKTDEDVVEELASHGIGLHHGS